MRAGYAGDRAWAWRAPVRGHGVEVGLEVHADYLMRIYIGVFQEIVDPVTVIERAAD